MINFEILPPLKLAQIGPDNIEELKDKIASLEAELEKAKTDTVTETQKELEMKVANLEAELEQAKISNDEGYLFSDCLIFHSFFRICMLGTISKCDLFQIMGSSFHRIGQILLFCV